MEPQIKLEKKKNTTYNLCSSRKSEPPFNSIISSANKRAPTKIKTMEVKKVRE